VRLPWARRLRRLVGRVRGRFAVRGLILMYHRVAELDADPWGLAVSPAHFAEHLTILRTRRSAITLLDLAEAIKMGRAPRRPIVVTFDDGYADNVTTARPLLEQYGIPATVFLTTGAIDSEREFWWDELERILLAPGDLPQRLELQQADCHYRGELGADARYSEATGSKHRLWRAWQDPPTVRHAMYYDLWRRLYVLPHSRKLALLDELLDWAGLEPLMRPTHRLVSIAKAKQLGRSSLIEIGAHTVTHPALPELPLVSQKMEIQQSKTVLEQLLGRSIRCFAYPHGHHSPVTMSAVREAGFTTACTTLARCVSKQSDCLGLPRFQVLDWSGDEFRTRLQAWQNADVDA
jgi:peptidoglycan/xylan/chitin deacetylase (PgdA/CDA1 family)